MRLGCASPHDFILALASFTSALKKSLCFLCPRVPPAAYPGFCAAIRVPPIPLSEVNPDTGPTADTRSSKWPSLTIADTTDFALFLSIFPQTETKSSIFGSVVVQASSIARGCLLHPHLHLGTSGENGHLFRSSRPRLRLKQRQGWLL